MAYQEEKGTPSMPLARPLRWAFLGRLSYSEGVALQEEIRSAIRLGKLPDHLLLLEHSHVYTLGRSADPADVVVDDLGRAGLGIEIAESDRGGQVTYHGPGQLVGYPILDLNPDRRDVRRYVSDLQVVLIRTLAHYGVTARGGSDSANIGVWVGDRKIASIGVHLSRWITTHGFALNVATDLSLFDGIVACGSPDVVMTSIEAAVGSAPDLEEIGRICAGEFARVFGRSLQAAGLEVLGRIGLEVAGAAKVRPR